MGKGWGIPKTGSGARHETARVPGADGSRSNLKSITTLHELSDKARAGDGPTPLILVGAGVNKGYPNQVNYSQGSVLRTLQEIFGLSPFLGSAAKSNDFSAMFTTFP